MVYPINADNSQVTSEYINTISATDFKPIQTFFTDETNRYGMNIKDPIEMRLGPVINEMPPLPPVDKSILSTIWWSLQLRYWSFMTDEYTGPRPDIRVFVIYHSPENKKRLPHSTALKKGMVGIVHAFADHALAQQNNFIIAHELLHTLGASDKYNLNTTLPTYPHGYAEPNKIPLFPQQFTEIMEGRIAISNTEARMPKDLSQALVGSQTALEIGWPDTK